MNGNNFSTFSLGANALSDMLSRIERKWDKAIERPEIAKVVKHEEQAASLITSDADTDEFVRVDRKPKPGPKAITPEVLSSWAGQPKPKLKLFSTEPQKKPKPRR